MFTKRFTGLIAGKCLTFGGLVLCSRKIRRIKAQPAGPGWMDVMNVPTLGPLRRVFPAALMAAWCPWFAGTAAAQARVTLGAKAGACEQRVVDDAMEVSSLRTFAAQVPDDIKSLVSAMEAGRRMQPAARQMVLQALQQAFDSSALDEEFHRGMRNHCDPKIFPVAIAQMRTPLGMKMRKLEDSLLTPQGRSALSLIREARRRGSQVRSVKLCSIAWKALCAWRILWRT